MSGPNTLAISGIYFTNVTAIPLGISASLTTKVRVTRTLENTIERNKPAGDINALLFDDSILHKRHAPINEDNNQTSLIIMFGGGELVNFNVFFILSAK